MKKNRQKETEFIEETGLLFDNFGVGRMPGRIMGWLLICDPPHQSSAQLAEKLQASKGSISTVTRLLVQMGFIKQLRLPGDRATYFTFTDKPWPEIIKRKLQTVLQMKGLASKGLQVLEDSSEETRARLTQMRDFYDFMERELPAVLDRWEESQKGQGK